MSCLADLSILYFILFLKILLDYLVGLDFTVLPANFKQSFCYYRYDMWSVGVVMLEMVLGTPNIFQINALTRALLDRHLEGWNEGVKELAYR
jgi:serine/threonine protein kinase